MARNSNGFLSTDTELIGFGSGKEYSGASGIYVDNENNVISITGEVGKEYNGIEPIVVNNEENLISANSAPIGVQEPLYFVQDDDEAVIIGLSGEYVTPSDITGKLDTSSFESWQQGQYTNDLTAINEKINEVSSNIPSLEGYATEQWVEDKGYLTAVSIPESANWEDTSEVVKTNSGTWNTVTDKLDVTAQVISSCETSSIDDKTLVTKLNGNEIAVSYAGSAHVADIALKDYQGNSFVPFYAKTSALEEKLDTTAFSTVSGDFLTAVNIPESATWNETTTVVQSNSAQWAEGGSTSGLVSGSNTLFVPFYPGASNGRVYSANISGDITVNCGDYFNSGENINIYATYSLSSVGSQIGDKLNKSVIEDSKTLSIIDDKAEVYSLAYKPSELVFTGITVNNYSSPDSVSIITTTQPRYKLYSACLVIESDGFDKNLIPNGWNFVNSANGSATFSRFYKNQSYDHINFPGFWNYNLTNASAYSVAYSGLVIDALAFKSDLTGVAGDEEVNTLVHSNSAAWNTVTDKLDTTAFSDVSSTFLTAVDLTPYQTIEGMTAYQPVGDYATTAEVDTLSSMLSGAIDYVSANVGGGGATYTSPSGTILINGNALEASKSAIGTVIKTANASLNNLYFSAIPGYPFDSYSAQSTGLRSFLTLRYGDWGDGFTVYDAMTANIIEIPLTSGGYDLWLYNGEGVRLSAVKSGVLELVNKDDLSDYATIVDRNNLSASISSVSSNLYGLIGKTFSSSKLGTIVVEGQNIEASTSAVTQVADTAATTNSDVVNVNTMPNYPYTTYKYSFGQYTNGVQAIYGNYTHTEFIIGTPQSVITIPSTYDGYNLTMVGYCEGVLSGIKSSVVELALKNDLPTYEYDSSNKISAINGSAIAAGDEFPASADEAITTYQNNSATYLTAHQAISADEWNSNYETVTTNSGAWGGSALPISAGPGIDVQLENNVLVFSNDETVLYSGVGTTAATLAEPITNFESIKVTYYPNESFYGSASYITEFPSTNTLFTFNVNRFNDTANDAIAYFNALYKVQDDVFTEIQYNHYWINISSPTNIAGPGSVQTLISKIVGINRIAGGN